MPATFSSKNIRPPIQDQISELQRKIQLLEGDRSAQYESSQCLIKKNREKILQLRQENKLLHRKLAEALAGDEQVIRDAFQSRSSEMAAYRNMSGKAVVQVLDQKVCDKVKKLNALKHMTKTQRRRLEELNTEYSTVRATRPGLQTDGVATNEGDFADVQPQKNLRVLENRLEKAQLKCQEAEHIMKSYQKLKEHLQEESLTFQSQLDELECEIIRQKQELRDLQLMNNNAHQAKDTAKTELQHKELMVHGERRERELVLNRYKKHAEEQKAQTDRGERRAQRVALHTDELSSELQRSGTAEGENDKTISSFEEAFTRITEATGVTDTQEVVDRFLSQRDTHTHLEQMKVQNELELQRLKEERDTVQTQYQDMKYSGETKLTHGRRVLEESVSQLQREEQRRDAAKETLDRITHTLNTVSNAVEHLCDKLQHITLQDAPVQRECVSPVSVVDLLREAELKLMQLQDGLQGRDIHTLMKEMEEQEFHASIEGKLPDYNTRITLPDNQRAGPFEEDSGDDDGDVITRTSLKRQSQLIIDLKTKRKIRLRKKKSKL
ncbi:coiled-coil domain-containing protein 151 isoform X2 [Pangasianodon hypophthalmus]|uniref:coiled-coil domain-containing protein 151 isoform X2 n=1 Tax=Pangasianodon hypophthalmus TaxID=310915 RepID=UPI00230815B9|nr:coiled-coil domain-containing protein 151 isoform X2 [Pangasianodon hypophthalmus]